MSSSVARRRPRQIRGWSPGESALILGSPRARCQREAARSLLKNLVNTFFHDRLVAVPTISAYIGRLQAEFGEDAAAER